MRHYVILTNRKRAIIALVHSVAFFFLSIYTAGTPVSELHWGQPWRAWIMPVVLAAVSSILAALTAFSGNPVERLYFGLCTGSAGFGFLRQVVGDAQMHFAVYLRVSLLFCAVATCMLIVRAYRPSLPAPE